MGLINKLKNAFLEEFRIIDVLKNNEEYKDIGSTGEQLTYRALYYYFEDKLFRNVYLRDEKGKLTEIDLLAVGNKGIYVFESKNYSGTIYGDEKYAYWKQYLGKKQNKFYNPILQNQRHIDVLKYNFADIPIENFFSIIIFSSRCKLNVKPTDKAFIIKRDAPDNMEFNQKFRKFVESKQRILSDEAVMKICDVLRDAQRPNEEIKQEHLEQIKRKNTK